MSMPQPEPQTGLPGQPTGMTSPGRFLITAAAFVVVVAGMRAASEIIVPFLLSVFLAVISTPALFWLKGKRINAGFAILLVSLVILLAGILVGTILTASIADFTKDLPEYATKLNTQISTIEQKWNSWLNKLDKDFHLNTNGAVEDPQSLPAAETPAPERQPETSAEEKTPILLSGIFDAQAGIKVVGDLVTQFGNLLTKAFLIYLTTIFILLEASILPSKIKVVMTGNPETFKNLSSIARDVKKYLAIKTVISLATGFLVTVWLTVLGVKYAVVWGLVAFLLNFVPNIGSIIAAIPACLLALVQLGIGSAVLSAIGYLVINMVIGNIIEPRVMGHRMGLSTLIVFLSLVFWGWVLGPVGMLLSVPLTMAVKIVLQSYPETRNLAILLGSENPPTPLTIKSLSGDKP